MNDIVLVDGGLSNELSQEIADLEKAYKELEARSKEVKAKLKEIMNEAGVVKIENDVLVISCTAPTTTERIDSKALKAELPDIYNAYCKIEPRAGSIRITVK